MGICLVKCSGLLILHVLLLCMAMNKSTGLTPDGNFCTLSMFVAFLIFLLTQPLSIHLRINFFNGSLSLGLFNIII